MENTIKTLLVEDVLVAQKIARMTLEELGCQVDVAENGQTALKLFKENKYDIVFMDLGLPDMNGFDVTLQVRKIENNENHVPIIALTANFDDSDKLRCFEVGMDDFMLKPIVKENGQLKINKFVKSTN